VLAAEGAIDQCRDLAERMLQSALVRSLEIAAEPREAESDLSSPEPRTPMRGDG
jgi:hypothetical protein